MAGSGIPLLVEHLERLNLLSTNIAKFYVVSPRSELDVGGITNALKRLKGRDIELLVREDNHGFSYGSWEYYLKTAGHEHEYSFLIEDDYCPMVDYFEDVFLRQFDDKTGYVCQCKLGEIAAVSNGVIRGSVFDECGFDVSGTATDYGSVEKTQVGFLNNVVAAGYSIKDISGDSLSRFDRMGSVESWGNKDGVEVIGPIK